MQRVPPRHLVSPFGLALLQMLIYCKRAMHSRAVTKDPSAVQAEVQSACLEMFPDANSEFVSRAFEWLEDCFAGRYDEYQAVDTHYHDLEHTLQGTLCMTRLLLSRHRAGVEPRLTARAFQLGLIAILFHDTGYLKQKGDLEGTGAKYTLTHVDRSADFAAGFMEKKGYLPADIRAVRNMIHCTGINSIVSAIQFQDELERIVGFTLGTADLLGQMAADDYVEKLPTLFSEFAEAIDFSHDHSQYIARFKSPEDLIRNTPEFWNEIVWPKLENDFLGLYRFLNDPYPSGPNAYLEKIHANLQRLEGPTRLGRPNH